MMRERAIKPVMSLMTYRVVVITTLLISTFIIELVFHPEVPLRAFYVLGAGTYLLTLIYAGLSLAKLFPRRRA